MCVDDFVSGHKFYDSKNYSVSFRRSGDFSINESDVLERCGYVITQLMEGKITAENASQERMLELFKGGREADTVVEKAWSKYLYAINHPKYLTVLASTNRDVEEAYDSDSDSD